MIGPAHHGAAPTITVVLPVHGTYTRFLQECIGSIQAQTYTEWQTIVVDDGSEHDFARETVERIGDERIRCIRHHRNRGLAAARNTGIRETSSDLVVPVDVDDMLAPRHLERLKAALDENPSAAAAFPDFELFGAVTGELRFQRRGLSTLLTEQWIPGSGTMLRRALWLQTGGYCEADELRAGNEDWDFWLSASDHIDNVIHVPEPLYLYRQHSASMVRKLQAVEHLTREFMYARHKDLFDLHNRGRHFLAEGYARAAKASLLHRNWGATAQLGTRAIRLAPAETFAFVLRSAGRYALRSAQRVSGRSINARFAVLGYLDILLRFAAGEA